MDNIIFKAGNNITINVPIERYEETIHFYRDILLLDTEEQITPHPSTIKSTKIKFGEISLWLDAFSNTKESKICLEINTDQMQKALDYLRTNKIQLVNERDKVSHNESSIKDPAGNILFLHTDKNDL